MRPSQKPTQRESPVPVVVLVGAPHEGKVVQRAAAVAASARVELASVGSVSTVVAEWRPFALVVPEDVYAFDAAEFDALGRDVGAEVVVIPEGMPLHKFEYKLTDLLREAYRNHFVKPVG